MKNEDLSLPTLIVNVFGVILLLLMSLIIFPIASLVIGAQWMIGKPTEMSYVCPKTWTRQYRTFKWFKRK